MITGRDCFGTGIVAFRHKGSYAPGIKTLPEILVENGYAAASVGLTGNPAARGFDRDLDYKGWSTWKDGRARKAGNLNAVAIPELRRLAAQDKPFFLFLRHLDPHSPYLPPEPYDRIFYAGDEFNKKNRSLEKTYAFKPFCDYFRSWFPPGCTDAGYIKSQYDGGIAYMDACIAVLLEEVKVLGIEDETLIVITSDHGESLDEHECWFDHHGLYDCTLSVPLFFRYPARIPGGARFGDMVTLKDVMPTVLDILGIKRKGMPTEGRSLLPRMSGGGLEQEDELYLTECTWERKHGWRTPQYKLIKALEPDFHYKSEVELYDLIKDPGENDNIAAKEPAIVKTLLDRMERWIKKREKETGRTAPIFTSIHWHGREDRGPFTSSDEAYNTLHIGERTDVKTDAKEEETPGDNARNSKEQEMITKLKRLGYM
jgi:arylsulfatase A-like enzyme